LLSIFRALVFANGDLDDGPAVQDALTHAPEALIIAADGGARVAQACGLLPHLVIGDLDSLTSDEIDHLRAQHVTIHQHPAHKDETDLELALLHAISQRITWIRILGAAGGRLDQMLANVYLLALHDLAGCDVRLVSGRQTLWLVGPGLHVIEGAPGDTISLLPWGGDAGPVRTGNLEYPLTDETLIMGPARGVSNVMLGTRAEVSLGAGMLLVVHTVGRA
jgi:thiamine pyrophosphokinase